MAMCQLIDRSGTRCARQSKRDITNASSDSNSCKSDVNNSQLPVAGDSPKSRTDLEQRGPHRRSAHLIVYSSPVSCPVLLE